MEIILLFWSIFGGISTALSAVACMKYLGKNSIPNPVVILVLIMGTIATLFSVIHSSVPLVAIKMVFLLCVVVSSIFMYIKERWIPMEIIYTAAGVRIALLIAELIVLKGGCGEYILRDVLGGVFGFGVPFVVNLIFKDYFNKDEIMLFGIMGIFCGYSCTYATIVFALVASYLTKLFIIYKGQLKKNINIPHEPFLLFGYVIMMMLYRI